jgi:hypothetical protein
MVSWLHCFWVRVRQNIIAKENTRAEVLASLPGKKDRREREEPETKHP